MNPAEVALWSGLELEHGLLLAEIGVHGTYDRNIYIWQAPLTPVGQQSLMQAS